MIVCHFGVLTLPVVFQMWLPNRYLFACFVDGEEQ